MRVANPIGLAEILLREDKGWDAAYVNGLVKTGPMNNEIAIEHKIPVHVTYFTALVSDDDKLQTFPDVYGHERRITQALEGKWEQIVKGRDHLAPVEVNLAGAAQQRTAKEDASSSTRGQRRNKRGGGGEGFFENIFSDDGL
jgi:L,D-transpeptidase YcbB